MTSSEQEAGRIHELEVELARLRADLDAARAEAPLLNTLMRDIAERQQIEARLRETQEWLHLAQAAGAVSAYSYEPASGELSWSPSAWSLYGVDPSSPPSFEAWLGAVHPHDRERVLAVVEAAVERGAEVDLQYRLSRADGSLRWVHDRGRVTLDETGRPARVVGVNIDITEQHRREEALARSEARLRALAEATAAAVWMCDADGEIVQACPSWGAFTGQSPEEYFGRGWLKAVHPDDQARAAAAWARAVDAQAPYEVIYRLRRHDGQWRLTQARGTPVRDETGAVREWIGCNFDITEQHAATVELQDRQERLRAALAGSGAGTFRWDLRTNALDWDEELDRLFGLEPGRTARNLEAFVAMVHPDDRGGVIERCERSAAEGCDFEMTFRVIWPDGEVRWLYDRGGVYRDADGRPAYMTGACIDVTAAREATQRLSASEERLRIAQEAGEIGAFEWFPETGVVVASEQYFRLFGLPPTGQVDQEVLMDLLHPEDRGRAGPRQLTAGEASLLHHAEYRIRRADTGETRWLVRRGAMLPAADGRPARMIGAVYDVTDQRIVEERLNDVLESVSDGFLGVDAQWRLTVINGAARRYLGLDQGDILGRDLWALMDDIRGTPIEGALSEAMRSRRPATLETASIRRPGRFVELRIAPKARGGLAIGFSDITGRHEAERRRNLLVNELNHRVKNTLAIVQGTAALTLRRAIPAPAWDGFEGRLSALSRAHDILTRRDWEDAFLHELAGAALAPFAQGRISVSGPELRLPAKTAVSFALAMHELATNAAKYGALSCETGTVSLSWRVTRIDGEPWLKLRWTERGGPPVATPGRRGFGSRLIEQALATELGGQVKLDFERAGVTCAISAPMRYLESISAAPLDF